MTLTKDAWWRGETFCISVEREQEAGLIEWFFRAGEAVIAWRLAHDQP